MNGEKDTQQMHQQQPLRENGREVEKFFIHI
jgi:hypothetical protein